MTREEASELARAFEFASECIQYYVRVSSYHDCNDCGKTEECAHVPNPGEQTRINCPLWKNKND